MHRAVLLAAATRSGAEAICWLQGCDAQRRARRPAAAAAPTASPRLVGRTVAEVERDLILDTLQHCLGNRTHAANILGISIRTLRNKLKRVQRRGRAGARRPRERPERARRERGSLSDRPHG